MLLSRRSLLVQASLLPLVAQVSSPALAALSPAFDFDSVVAQAKALAAADYAPPARVSHPWLRDLSYDAYRDIRFNPQKALWRDKKLPIWGEFFHPGALFLEPVEIYEVNAGNANLVAYNPAFFNFGKLSPPADLSLAQTGYAGFRLHTEINNPGVFDEFVVFLGASYFRAVGKGQAYGLSARGLAIDTAESKGEEFPVFRRFWLERPTRRAKQITLYALLDSPSIAGAYKFVITPGESTEMQVSCRLFPRKDIAKLGVAPLTSMYAFGENDNRLQRDFRPEVHDNDGLLVHNGAGEWLWRPLLNPLNLGLSTLGDENPRGFGLLQRDRSYEGYQDLEARYEDRPSLWVTPKGKWGKGAVQLVEIPTDSEIHDNIVAYWVPATPVKAGQDLSFDYQLSWGNGPKADGRLPEVVATHVGRQFDHERTKFVIDFKALNPRQLKGNPVLMPDLWSSSGKLMDVVVMPNPHIGGWRVFFSLRPEAENVIELRCALRHNGKAATETWIYQWRP